MTALLFDIDGTPTPAADCDWQLRAPCGCVMGLSVIERRNGILVDEDAAWRQFEPGLRVRKRMLREGYSVRIGLRSEGVRLLRLTCPNYAGEVSSDG